MHTRVDPPSRPRPCVRVGDVTFLEVGGVADPDPVLVHHVDL
jgi:hypothetical protein